MQLTPKETLIVSCVTQGMKNKEIALRVGTTEQVVKNYLRKVYDKLGVADRLELALYCLNHHVVDNTKVPPLPVLCRERQRRKCGGSWRVELQVQTSASDSGACHAALILRKNSPKILDVAALFFPSFLRSSFQVAVSTTSPIELKQNQTAAESPGFAAGVKSFCKSRSFHRFTPERWPSG